MKKVLSIAIALVMLLGLASASAETITMLQRLPAQYVVEDNPVIKAWGDMYDVTIDIEAPPISSYNDRRNVIMASGDLPDIIYVGDVAAMYTQWAKEGLFLDLTDLLTDGTLPNAAKVLTEEELSVVRVDGRIYSLPRVQTKPMDCIIYRGDWLENLGLEIPTTVSEFADVMLAFATQDPDGNGVDDTYGWSLNTENGAEHRSIISGFNIHPNEVPNADGTYSTMQAQPAYMEYLDWMREMYANGSMDPEFYLTKMYEDDDLFYAGKLGAVYSSKVVEHLITIANNESFIGANPDAYLVVGPPLKPDGAEIADVYYQPQVWGNYAINVDSDNIEMALKILNEGYTDPVNELMAFGLQGVTYEEFFPEERYVTRNEEQKLAADKYCATYATINYQRADKGLLIANGNTAEEVAKFNEANDRIASQTNRVAYMQGNPVEGYGDADIKIEESGIRQEWREIRTKYVTGEIDKATIEDFIQNKYAPAFDVQIDLYRNYNDGAGYNK